MSTRILKRSPKGASKGSGRSEDSDFVWLLLRKRVTVNLRISQETKGARQGTVERFEDRPQHRNEQKRVQVQMPQVRQLWSGYVFQRSERIRSK